MYDPELRRTPRELATTQQVLDLCAVASSRAAAVRMCQPIGMWPERSALLEKVCPARSRQGNTTDGH